MVLRRMQRHSGTYHVTWDSLIHFVQLVLGSQRKIPLLTILGSSFLPQATTTTATNPCILGLLVKSLQRIYISALSSINVFVTWFWINSKFVQLDQ